MPVSNFYFNEKKSADLGVAIHIYNPRIWEVGKGGFRAKAILGHTERSLTPSSVSPSQKKKKKLKKK